MVTVNIIIRLFIGVRIGTVLLYVTYVPILAVESPSFSIPSHYIDVVVFIFIYVTYAIV